MFEELTSFALVRSTRKENISYPYGRQTAKKTTRVMQCNYDEGNPECSLTNSFKCHIAK